MSRFHLTLSSAALVAIAVTGCGTPPDSAPSATSSEAADPSMADSQEHQGQDEHAGHDTHHEGDGSAAAPQELAQYSKELAQLSDDDRAAVYKQKTCPVSGDALGSMGKPYKVTVKDREVFLCCSGCKGEITENPDKFLAKLPEAK